MEIIVVNNSPAEIDNDEKSIDFQAAIDVCERLQEINLEYLRLYYPQLFDEVDNNEAEQRRDKL